MSGYAFFDVDSRHPDPTNSVFVVAEKALSVKEQIERIVATAAEMGAPMLSTTCLGVQRVQPTLSVRGTVLQRNALEGRAFRAANLEMAFVGLEASEEEVVRAMGVREVFLERKGCAVAEDNVRLRTIDVFGVNKHAARIVNALGDRHWLVYGTGFEGCVVATVEGLRALGKRVTVLEDALISARGANAESRVRAVEKLKALGAEFSTLRAVLNVAVAG